MVDLMRSLGVEAVPTTGTPFDPSIHDAIMREPSSEHPDGTVLLVRQRARGARRPSGRGASGCGAQLSAFGRGRGGRGAGRSASRCTSPTSALQEFRKGFSIGGKLLRPAMVKVSSALNGAARRASPGKLHASPQARLCGRSRSRSEPLSPRAIPLQVSVNDDAPAGAPVASSEE
jgi:hypothetical protein